MAAERTTLKVPELPESVADATVMALHKKPGEVVRRGEVLVELETDKVVLEVPAPNDGVMDELAVEEGAVVQADAVLGYLRAMDGNAPVAAVSATPPVPAPIATGTPQPAIAKDVATAASVPKAPKPTPAAPPAMGTEASAPAPANSPSAPKPTVMPAPPPPPAASESAAPTAAEGAAAAVGPAIRRLLQEHGLAAEAVTGSGPGGRILKEDVLAHVTQQRRAAATAVQSSAADTPPELGGRSEERQPLSRLRARIAERLLEAKQSTAMLTTFNEVDLSEIMVLRNRHRDVFEKRHGVRLGFMGFFVSACARALERFPVVNAALDGNEIVFHHYADIGIAVAAPRGLVVPILRDAQQLSIAAIERKIRDFGERARDGKLELDDLRGGTFTITNGGVFGSLLSTPILNPPQSAILGMHAIQERPVARDGQVVIRPMMYLALSYDHRLIDGADAVRFLVTVKEALEDPTRLFLEL